MPDVSLHLPADWERKAAVRRLILRLGQSGYGEQAPMAPLYFVRMWTEWASNPEDWRPLKNHVDEASSHDWPGEDLAWIIEDACGWKGLKPGDLLRIAIEAGIYTIVQRGEISGLVLAEWQAFNEHLMREFKSMQQRGGEATRRTTAQKLAANMAAQQASIFEQQGFLVLNAQTESKDEQRAALALVIQIDRQCGHAVRVTSQYSEPLLHDAVEIIRRHPQPVIDQVLTYLHESRANPEVVKVPERILQNFDDYLAASARARES